MPKTTGSYQNSARPGLFRPANTRLGRQLGDKTGATTTKASRGVRSAKALDAVTSWN